MMVFMLALMTVIVAMSMFVLVFVVITTAMVALTQLMDVVGAHAASATSSMMSPPL